MPLTDVGKFEFPVSEHRPAGASLRLFLIEDGDESRVILYGDRDKLCFRGSSLMARSFFDAEVAKYRARIEEGD